MNTAREVNGGVIKIATGTAAVFNNYKGMGVSFQLNFGKAKATATERLTLFEVKGLPLQVIVVQAAPHVKSAADATLANYIILEVEYTSQSMAAPIKPQIASMQVKPGQSGKIWSYYLPVGMSDEVEQQVFLNFVHGNFIIGLGSAQFRGQSLPAGVATVVLATLIYLSNSQAARALVRAAS